MSLEVQTYHLDIGGPQLREQRETLLRLIDAYESPHKPSAWLNQAVETGAIADTLHGTTNLLDEIADQAHDQYGIDCLIQYSEDSRGETL